MRWTEIPFGKDGRGWWGAQRSARVPLVVKTGESIKFKLSAYHFTKILLEYCLGGDYPFALHLLQSCSGDVVIIFVSSVMSKGVRLIMT